MRMCVYPTRFAARGIASLGEEKRMTKRKSSAPGLQPCRLIGSHY
jgi:hypothetical protein